MEDDLGNIEYLLACSESVDANSQTNDDIVDEVRTPGTHVLQANPGYFVDCSVTPRVEINTAPVLGPIVSEEDVEVGLLAQTTATFTAEPGGFRVEFTTDASISDPTMLTLSLSCTSTSGDPVNGLTDVALSLDSSPSFFDTESQETLLCTVTTELTVNGTAAPVQPDEVAGSVTPEEPSAEGLPIWLLYEVSRDP